MLGKVPPTTSNLNLVSFEVSDATAAADVHDGIKMTDIVESLDARELDMDEGEETDYDGNYLGVCVCVFFFVALSTSCNKNIFLISDKEEKLLRLCKQLRRFQELVRLWLIYHLTTWSNQPRRKLCG